MINRKGGLMQKTMRHPIFKWFWIVAALELIAISINMFYAPHAVAAGGATGIAILVQEVAGIQVGITTMGVNLLMLLLAWFFLDRSTLKRILFGSFMLPLLLWLTPEINLVTDRLLAIIVGIGGRRHLGQIENARHHAFDLYRRFRLPWCRKAPASC